MDFSGKVVLVTGASSGIGEDAAIGFAELGAKVVIVGRNEDRLHAVAEKIKNAGSPTPLAIAADIVKDAAKIVEQTISHFGKLDVLVNNAGIVRMDTASDVKLEEHDDIFATNCRAAVEIAKLAVPYLEQTKGNVVNVSSLAGITPNKATTSYSMSKAALDMYTKCASLELAPRGVRVNSVNPGLIVTPIFQWFSTDSAQVDAFLEKARTRYPVGRVGAVSDTTNAILFLADEKSSFINGVLLPVDGGKLHV